MSTDTTVASIAYHWIMTVLLPDGTMTTYSGVFAPETGTSRADVFAQLTGEIKKQRGVSTLVILCFDLAPNEMPGGAR